MEQWSWIGFAFGFVVFLSVLGRLWLGFSSLRLCFAGRWGHVQENVLGRAGSVGRVIRVSEWSN
jgi:hypothetical protein